MADDPKNIGGILDRLEELAGQDDQVSLGKVTEALGSRSHGPFLLVPALIEISPVGGIPGVPTVLAAIIILFAGQLLIGRDHMWLPGFLARRSVSSDRTRKATGKLRPLARFMDRWFHGRLPKLTEGPAVRVAAALCILLACTVPPLEVLPFASSAPMLAIAAFGLALLVRDGLLMMIATVLAVVAVAVGVGVMAGGSRGG